MSSVWVYHGHGSRILLKVKDKDFKELSERLQDFILRLFQRSGMKDTYVARETYGDDSEWDEAFVDLLEWLEDIHEAYYPYGNPMIER